MKNNVLIIDDDINIQDYVKSYLLSLDQTGWVRSAKSVTEGKQLIEAYKPDLVFLDVELPDGLGFDILESISYRTFSVIFITAHDQYAIRAIKFSAIDYLLKPFDHKDIQNALNRLMKFPDNNVTTLINNLNQSIIQERRIGISTLSEIHYIKVKEIVRCEANGNYTVFRTLNNKEIVSSRPIKEYEEALDEYSFIRVHKSHLINIEYVLSYNKSDGGSVVMKDGYIIPISKVNKAFFIKRFKKLLI